jgi:hypothetical protein
MAATATPPKLRLTDHSASLADFIAAKRVLPAQEA